MTLLENNAPNVDAAVGGPMRSVYADLGKGSRPLGACSDAQGESRSLLRMPAGIGASLPWYSEVNADRIAGDSEYAKRVSAERSQAMRWSGRNQQPLYLGTCAQADSAVRRLYGNSVVAVSVGGYTTDIAQAEHDRVRRCLHGSGPSVASTFSGGAVSGRCHATHCRGSSRYNLIGVAHDRNCGGNFVIGTVSNASGAAVAGVRVQYRDQFGNRLETATSGQMPGYGSFRFAIGDNTPQNISVTLLDGSGGAISSSASVPHMQGDLTDLGCHYTIWQGVD